MPKELKKTSEKSLPKFSQNGLKTCITDQTILECPGSGIRFITITPIFGQKSTSYDWATICYKVGTLRIQNCNEICNALAKLLRNKRVKPKRLFVIVDFNLRNVNRETNSSSNNVEQLFLEEFFRFGLIQCIKAPTHIKGNILDVLLTNSENLISDI